MLDIKKEGVVPSVDLIKRPHVMLIHASGTVRALLVIMELFAVLAFVKGISMCGVGLQFVLTMCKCTPLSLTVAVVDLEFTHLSLVLDVHKATLRDSLVLHQRLELVRKLRAWSQRLWHGEL